MALRVTVYYVPADCGSVIPGKSRAPAAFRNVGLVRRLQDRDLAVDEIHALEKPAEYALSALTAGRVRNEELNLSVCNAVYGSMTDHHQTTANDAQQESSPFQLVIGGECCMLLAIIAAMWSICKPLRVGLLYIDGDLDMASPTDPDSKGFFASMNMTHLLGRPGALKSMQQRFCRIGDGGQSLPVCDASNTVFFGANKALSSNKQEHFAFLAENGFKVITSDTVARSPRESAREALAFLEERVDVIMVHLDVDSIDPSEFPLANVPNFTGVSHPVMFQALEVVMGSSKVGGLTVAEVNPDHDPGLGMTTMLADRIAEWVALNKGVK